MPFGITQLVKDRPKTASELVSKTLQSWNLFTNAKKEKQSEKALEDVARYLQCMKIWLFGDDEHEPNKDSVASLVLEICKTDLLLYFSRYIRDLDFETRKDAAQVFGACVRMNVQDTYPGAEYVEKHPEILELLFQGYDDPPVALNCGAMFRDCLKTEPLCKVVLSSDMLYSFFDKVEVPNFEIASDAFSSFKEALTRHKDLVSVFLKDGYTEFFEAYNKLLKSSNYVTRRQSLMLLGRLLLDRSNVTVMVRFVSDASNLMTMMNLLKDTSRNIQFEAFHVFKVFVANPHKPKPIVDILVNNKEKLLKYLEDFHVEREEDEQFRSEKAQIIKQISLLGLPSSESLEAAAE